jgi:hypothetical protein
MQTSQISKDKVLSYTNNGVVKKYAREHNASIETATEHFTELKKFLYLCATKKGTFTPSRVVDNIWHTFILFTQDYSNFCAEHFGQFIHHKPDVEISIDSKQKNNNNYRHFFGLLVDEFGVPSDDIWALPLANLSVSTCTRPGGDGNCSSQGEPGDCINPTDSIQNATKQILSNVADCSPANTLVMANCNGIGCETAGSEDDDPFYPTPKLAINS